MPTHRLYINGQTMAVEAEDNTSLLLVLRNQLGQVSVRYGCGLGQCGACKVLIDGKPQSACTIPVSSVTGSITSVEGLGDANKLHPLQQAFLEYNAAQCGYCASGILIAASALLANNLHPSRQDIQAALQDNLCRCGAHNRIIRAVQHAAELMRGGS